MDWPSVKVREPLASADTAASGPRLPGPLLPKKIISSFTAGDEEKDPSKRLTCQTDSPVSGSCPVIVPALQETITLP